MKNLLYVSALFLLLGACSPIINTQIQNHYKPLPDMRGVVIYNAKDTLPQKPEILGQVKVGGGLFVEDGKYDHVLLLAVQEAQKNGGNALQIERLENPSLFGSGTHTVVANILKFQGIDPDSTAANNPEMDKLLEGMRYSPFRLVINAGLGHFLGKDGDIPSSLKDYYNDLRNGKLLGVEATWFWNRSSGMGIEFQTFNAKNETDITVSYEDGQVEFGKLSDDIQIDYYALSWNSRYVFPSRLHSFLSSLSMGYVSYKNDYKILEPFTIKGGAFGMKYSIGYDYCFAPGWALGFSTSLFFSTLQSATITRLNTNETIHQSNFKSNLSKISIETGLRYSLPLLRSKFERK